MDVLGVHLRVSNERYAAGFAIVSGLTIIDTWALPAPADSDEGVQLSELHRFAADLIHQRRPDQVSIKGTEAGTARATCVAQHGEGAVLAAAGLAGKPARVWTGPGYRAAVGAPSNAAVLQVARSNLAGGWPSSSEERQAVAAAMAMIRRPDR